MEANATVSATSVPRKSLWRTLMILGRVSNLPTVWSNCLAGWILAGGGEWERLLLLCAAASFLYIFGMYLNDAFDADFDRQHRIERPIPSGAISRTGVWAWSIIWLILGLACIGVLARTVHDPAQTIAIVILLVAAIILYDAVHKALTLSPIIMAACRFFLILLAASAGAIGITGLSIWTALGMASYVVGLSFIARHEAIPGALRYWPCIFLAAPVVLAFIVNRGDFQVRGFALSALLLLWIAQSLLYAYWTADKNLARCVSRLLAGIVLVDVLSVAHAGPDVLMVFAGLFVLALIFQHFIPAT
jgi:4-hydroxybenzoate polyprenyltransferase